MKKHTTSAGPTGFGWLRSLLTFRHRNPAGRLVATLAAFAMATLLVAGTAPAYAEDGDAAAPAETTSTDAAPEDVGAEPSDAPADEVTPDEGSSDDGDADEAGDGGDASTPPADQSEGGADPEAPAEAGDGGKSAGPMAQTLKKLAAKDVTIALVGNADCEDLPNTMVGGFEIDGDPCDDEGGIDFNGGPGDSTDDGYGDDGNWFTQGSSENDNPATWTTSGNSNTGKADIGTAWAWSHTYHSAGDPDDGHVFAYFGFTNDSTAGGTQDYSLEYNQAEPVNGKPVRTVGDLLFHFFANGNVALTYEASYIYTDEDDATWDDGDCVESGNLGAGWCPFELPAGAFVSAASSTGEYVEGSIDITEMFGEGNCSGTFGTTFLRSAPGAFFTSELKDYVAPLDVTTPSTCGTLQIEKTDIDTDEAVGGGVYQIEGDPRPGADPADTLCIYDGPDTDLADLVADHPSLATDCDTLIADGDADGTIDVGPVEPGTYTVTEIVPPPGYLLNPDADPTTCDDADAANPDNCETVTVGEGEDETVSFANHRQWAPLTISKSADGTFGARYLWDIDKEIAPTADGPWSDGTDPENPLLKNIEAGGDTSLYYRVTVTEEGVDTSAYVVTGTIHVGNPNPDTFPGDGAVEATLTESLSGCTLDATDEAFPVDVTVPSGGADFDYTCVLGDGPEDPGTNEATVAWDRSDYPQSTSDINASGNYTPLEATNGYDFVETASVDKTIEVTDDHFDFDPDWVITAGDDDTTEDGDPVGVYSSDVYSFDTETAAGSCSEVITNTATITGDGQETVDQDSESGQVCVEADLAVDVTSVETLTRTFPWDIDKDTTTPLVTVVNGQATAHYKVTITALPFEDGSWDMFGTVTITNPNLFTSKQVSDLDIAYSGGGTCAPTEALPLVAANSSAEVDFDCDFGDPATQPSYSGDVTATVKWDDDAESADDPTPWSVDEADWLSDATRVNEFIKVFDDHAVPGTEDPLFGGTQLKWQDVFDADGHQVSVEYDHVYSGGILPGAGACRNLVNTAWFTGDDPELSLGSDTATVQACAPAVLPPEPPEVIPPALPNTGGPDAMILGAGVVLLLGGGALVLGDRRRRHRS